MRYTVVFILTALVLSSCSHKNEAMELSRNFFTSLSDTTYGKPGDFYPLYDSLHIEAGQTHQIELPVNSLSK